MAEDIPRFPGVRGHAHAQARLSRAIGRGKLHHAIILVGPPGIGKATLARGLGCALHCRERPAVGCGTCNVCRRILSGVHVGVEHVVPEEPGAAIKVAAARELATRLELAPFEGDAHLVILDPAEAITEQGFNALLKTLEEPRPGVCFAMIATRLDALLPTILSRCLVVRLGRLGEPDVEAIVRERIATSEDPPPDEARIDLAVRLGDGRAGLAIELAADPSLDDALNLLQAVVEAADAGPPAIFGGDRSRLWAAWSEAVGPVKTGRPARERAVAGRTAELWLLHLRECLHGRAGLPGVRPEPGASEILLRRLDRVQALREGLDRNPNVRLALEQTLLELAPG